MTFRFRENETEYVDAAMKNARAMESIASSFSGMAFDLNMLVMSLTRLVDAATARIEPKKGDQS